MKYLILFFALSGCMSKATSLEDVTAEVISKDRGVTIDIEPGQKR